MRLTPHGWRDLLLVHGLDIAVSDLGAALRRPLAVDREQPGFEDFTLAGTRGVEPGDPARSLLFHAFASPRVLDRPDGQALGAYPTWEEIEAVENYVWAQRKASLPALRRLAAGKRLAIAVFACEYRPALDTVHGRHADLVYSRTGVARVGNEPALYDRAARGYLPAGETPSAIRVLPARYAPYLAVQHSGAEGGFGPMDAAAEDAQRSFWVPLHKLFAGSECIAGRKLTLRLRQRHRNEKLRRVHLELERRGHESEFSAAQLAAAPFVIESGIADFSHAKGAGMGLLEPQAHPLVEAALLKGAPLTFSVPAGSETLSSSVYLASDGGARSAPEYVHARTRVRDDGAEEDLNAERDVVAAVEVGGYRARHYLDWTGDGWVAAECAALAVEIPRSIAAYSLVTAPDFFPGVDQRELLRWSEQSVPAALREALWAVEPETLAHTRLPPNLQLPGSRFRAEDVTATALVSLPGRAALPVNPELLPWESNRHSHLPDAAAGVFAPGWDVSFDRTPEGVEHLASYGLGSPFPEDAKLCAALSTFWPAVAPDAARTFQPSPLWPATNSWPGSASWPTVAPLTDEEIGIGGGLAWDGVPGPVLTGQGNAQFVEYTDIAHADYVRNAVAGKFTLNRTARVGDTDYRTRVLYMARLYAALGVDSSGGSQDEKAQWSVLSFRAAPPGSPERAEAEEATTTALEGSVYTFRLYRFRGVQRHPSDVSKVRVEVRELVDAFVDPLRALVRRGGGPWVVAED